MPRCVVILLLLSCSAIAQPPEPSTVPAPGPNPQLQLDKPRTVGEYCKSLLPGDPHSAALEEACVFALMLPRRLPNFMCDMDIQKFGRRTHGPDAARPIQHVTGKVRLVDGQDSYENLRIDGKQKFKESDLFEGTWPVGEFGLKLMAAFAPEDEPSFRFLRETNLDGRRMFEYQFAVRIGNNRIWKLASGDKTVYPGFDGKILVDAVSFRIVRLNLATADVPKVFRIHSVASETHYQLVDFNDGSTLDLPYRAFNSTEVSDATFTNDISFSMDIRYSNCQRFRATSRIITTPEEAPKK